MPEYTKYLFSELFAGQALQSNQIVTWGEANTTNPTPPADTLTARKLLDAMDKIEAVGKIDPGIDIYGHDLLDQEQAFTLDRRQIHKNMYAGRSAWMRKFVEHANLDRLMVIVPRARLLETFHAMKAQGLDIRLEPRYGTGERAKKKDGG
jgi:hypothetical protein